MIQDHLDHSASKWANWTFDQSGVVHMYIVDSWCTMIRVMSDPEADHPNIKECTLKEQQILFRKKLR